MGQEAKEEVLFRTLPSQVPQPTCYWNGSWGTFLDPAPLFEHPSKTIGARTRNRPVLGIPACGGDLKLLLRFELKILNKLSMVDIVFNVLILIKGDKGTHNGSSDTNRPTMEEGHPQESETRPQGHSSNESP